MSMLNRKIYLMLLQYLSENYDGEQSLVETIDNLSVDDLADLYQVIKNTVEEHITSNISQIYGDNDCSQANRKYQDGIYNSYISIIENACIYVLRFPSKEGKSLINIVLANDINTILEYMERESSFAAFIIKYYIKYLRSKQLAELNEPNGLTEKEETQFKINYPFLSRLKSHKGYETISQLARHVLLDLYDTMDSVLNDGFNSSATYEFSG